MELTLARQKSPTLPASEVEGRHRARSAPIASTCAGAWTSACSTAQSSKSGRPSRPSPGSSGFRIADVIANRGGRANRNFKSSTTPTSGAPLLGEGATFVAAIERITPFNAHGRGGNGKHTTSTPARPSVSSSRFTRSKPAARTPHGKNDGAAEKTRRAIARPPWYSTSSNCPTSRSGKNTNAVGEGYVTGIEPGHKLPAQPAASNANTAASPKLAAG